MEMWHVGYGKNDYILAVIRIWIWIQEFLKEFCHYAEFAMIKAPHCEFGNTPKTCRLADLKLNELKAAVAEVCGPRVLLFY